MLHGHQSQLSCRCEQEEEEERQREEDERQKKEATERRKAERLERRAQLKREGKLLTGKAKKEAERLAAIREQFLKQSGMEAPAGVLPCTVPILWPTLCAEAHSGPSEASVMSDSLVT